MRGCQTEEELTQMEAEEMDRAEDLGWDAQGGDSPAQWIQQHERYAAEDAAVEYAAAVRRQWAAEERDSRADFDAAIDKGDFQGAGRHLSDLMRQALRAGEASPPDELLRLRRVLAVVQRQAGGKQ